MLTTVKELHTQYLAAISWATSRSFKLSRGTCDIVR